MVSPQSIFPETMSFEERHEALRAAYDEYVMTKDESMRTIGDVVIRQLREKEAAAPHPRATDVMKYVEEDSTDAKV